MQSISSVMFWYNYLYVWRQIGHLKYSVGRRSLGSPSWTFPHSVLGSFALKGSLPVRPRGGCGDDGDVVLSAWNGVTPPQCSQHPPYSV